jgi:putative Mg2+ transporter-C (MgtC) family protein
MTGDGTEIFMKIGLSAFLGLMIGLERELKRKPVGLKTSLIIAMISCLLTIVSIDSAYSFPSNNHVNITMDPLRLAAQIISGIGFLGAGVILRRDNDSISGLTTAAMIWGAAGIGVAVGAGFYLESITGVAVLIASVELIPPFIKFVGPKRLRQKELFVKVFILDKNQMNEIMSNIQDGKISIGNICIKDVDKSLHLLELKISVDQHRKITEIYLYVSTINGVHHVEVESL